MIALSIEAIAYALPDTTETNDQLALEHPLWRMEEVVKKTGVEKRYIADGNQTAADLAVQAAEKILSDLVAPGEIDGLIMVTQTPDYALPTTACIIQDRLGLRKDCMAFDINLGCSGYIYGLSVLSALMQSGLVNKGLLLCGDTYRKFIAPDDRVSRPIFSDGAAATVLSPGGEGRIGHFSFGSDGSGCQHLILPESGTRKIEATAVELAEGAVNERPPGQLYMDGSKVFMFTMNVVPKLVGRIVDDAGLSLDDIDCFVFHQASRLVLDNIQRKLMLPAVKVYSNLRLRGNTVSASIPIALKDAHDEGRIKRGDRILLAGFGVGLSWGGCVVIW